MTVTEIRETLERNGFRIKELVMAPQGERQRLWITVFAEKQKTGHDEEPADTLAKRMSDMEAIHKINIDVIPPVEKGKTMWHVIPENLIPQHQDYNQRVKFIEFVNNMNRRYPGVREKIRIVTNKQDLNTVVAELAKDTNNMVNVALDDEKQIDGLPGNKNVKMLVFKPEGGALGDFRQLEGVLASLRALYIENYGERIDRLTALHKLLTGRPPKEFPPADASAKDFAHRFVFELPPIKAKDGKEIKILNDNLLELIRSA